MKKFIYFFAAITLLAFTTVKFDSQKATAIVNQEHGLYIFVDCKPAKDYTLITSIAAKSAMIDLKSFEGHNLSYNDLKDDFFKQMDKKKDKAKFTGAEALIIYPNEQKADVIKFK